MKPVTSPFLIAAMVAAFTLAVPVPCSFAQRSTTVTETTVEKKVTVEEARPKERVTTELEFQPASTANDINVQMLRDFTAVKNSDPSVGTEIAKNPALVQDAGFVGKHPSLQAFLEKYPDARQEIVSSPGNFVLPVAGSKWNSHEAAGIPRD
jgi:hypothetical protein